MPKPGYTRIIVKEEIKQALQQLARTYGFKIVNQLLENWVRVHPYVNWKTRNSSLFLEIDGPGGIRTLGLPHAKGAIIPG